ncbi:hypothetical protein BAUCODRAFT_119725 [Baudoinia panamericana UAMH 10762]|uniref:C2H2-type domain-containing protein n=1 Tax=Baudoinia panamericana (strain UAMH 10762) TaxID=717646 RepID=M2NLX2_BAUPA|nr:uncharacterized protein BAUCODRAFT_119725 [Baudoinia panamericana UAMH 10762]EMD00166.1 hypothetical protein BAUCODRAFT_119725 [Baudoinia panamericana UAMH 10762]
MDSHQRVRTNSSLTHILDRRGAIHKRTPERPRSVSASQAERLHQLALEQSGTSDLGTISATSGIQWITPQQSPEPQSVFADSSLEPFSTWTIPTPPCSDSGVPNVSLDLNNEDCRAVGISASEVFQFTQPTTCSEMSSLGLLLPSQYGATVFESEPTSYAMDQHYIPPMKITQPATSTGIPAYAQSNSTSPALYQSRRRSELPSNGPDRTYGQGYRRTSNPYETTINMQYSNVTSPGIPSLSGLSHSPLPSPHMNAASGANGMSQYATSVSRSPSIYDPGVYQQILTTQAGSYASTESMSYPPPFIGSSVNDVLAKPLGSDASMRVLNQRPKPQCWDHGCNGRQFSTFSNLLRHQREKSGTAAKSYCPKCGAEFTRTTARNGHLAHDKCSKQRRPSEEN